MKCQKCRQTRVNHGALCVLHSLLAVIKINRKNAAENKDLGQFRGLWVSDAQIRAKYKKKNKLQKQKERQKKKARKLRNAEIVATGTGNPRWTADTQKRKKRNSTKNQHQKQFFDFDFGPDDPHDNFIFF